MSASVKQAVESVKAGNSDRAQQLLAEILAREPDNEQAWLWLAYTLEEVERHFCLKQALRINPQNQQVQQAIHASTFEMEGELLETAKATQKPAIIEPSIDPGVVEEPGAIISSDDKDYPTPVQPIDSGDKALMEAVQFWLVPGGRELQTIILGENRLFKAISSSRQQKEIVKSLDASQIPYPLFERFEEVPYDDFLSVVQDKSHINIRYKNDKIRDLSLRCTDDRMANTVLNALGRKLGPGYERQTEASRMNAKIVGAFLVFMLVAILTLVLIMASLDISSGGLALPIGDETLELFETIGPFGVLIAGGIIMLISFIYMVLQYMRPPKKTKLVPDKSLVSSPAES